MEYCSATYDEFNDEAEFLLALEPSNRRNTVREQFAAVLHEVAAVLREAGHPAPCERTKRLLVDALGRVPGPLRSSTIATIYHACQRDRGVAYLADLAGRDYPQDPFTDAANGHRPYRPCLRTPPGATMIPLASVPRRIRTSVESAPLPEWPDGYRTRINDHSGAFDDACKRYEELREAHENGKFY